MADRRAAVERVARRSRRLRPAARARRRAGDRATGPAPAPPTPAELAAELRERLDGDLERGFTGHGPHRDDLVDHSATGRELRTYGSQGQQRLGLLALLLAEREAIGRAPATRRR